MTTGTSTSENATTPDAIYVRNMAALFRWDARLAQRIDELEDDGTVLVETSKKGAPTASIRDAATGRTLQLHSRIDPLAEAQRLADSVEVGESFCYVVGGFAMGHHLKSLKRRLKGDAFFVVFEPNLQVVKKALESVDLAELFDQDRCVILDTADKGEVQARLEPYNNLMMIGTQFVAHPASERLAPAFFNEMRKLIADHMTYCRMCLVTLVANSRLTSRNVANNLPAFLATPPIDVLRDRFKGCPGVVVAAGPSLRKNIDQLAGMKGKAVIIAVQTTFKMLRNRGIEPDFVTSLDYHELSRQFFEGIDDFGQTHLVAEPKVNWQVVDTYKGRISLIGNDFASHVLGDSIARRGCLKAGATVAQLAFYLAEYMGCWPIVLVGQDLAYTGHVYYTPGVAYHDMWRPDLNRFWTMEMKEWERIVTFRKLLMKVKDIHGRELYTDEQLFTYLQQFEGDFAAVPGRVIDATEGGVRKAGTQVMTLAEVAERFCTRDIPAETFAYRDRLAWWDPSRFVAARQQIRERIAEIDAMAETCRRFISVLKELTELLSEPTQFNRRIGEIDALRVKIKSHERAYRLVSSVSQHAELQRFAADRRLGLAGELEEKERARRQLQRDIRFVEAILEGTDACKEILTDANERLGEAIAASQLAGSHATGNHNSGREDTR